MKKVLCSIFVSWKFESEVLPDLRSRLLDVSCAVASARVRRVKMLDEVEYSDKRSAFAESQNSFVDSLIEATVLTTIR